METKFNFNSQICTTREQSKRLLALGLRKETADMCYTLLGGHDESLRMLVAKPCFYHNDIPAWSLHRLIELRYGTNWIAIAPKIHIERVYDNFIDAIEEGIKKGYFNKEYLV